MPSPVDRRQFIASLGASSVAAALPLRAMASPAEPSSPQQKRLPGCWINEALAAHRKPWRKVHLDFHNSHHQPEIGARFNAEEFGDRLLAANVNSVVVFAKDMHGNFYYPTKYGPVHPGLSFDLLGAQVQACRKRGIQVLAYYCCTWDHHLARSHPEWLLIRRDGSNYLPKPHQTPGWTALCPAHPAYVQLLCDHATEFLSRYELDGPFFDMSEPKDAECFCPECQRQLQAMGADPKDAAAQLAHKHQLHLDLLKRLYEASKQARPGCQVDFNNIGLNRVGDRLAWLDNVDIEALPTGAGWGYWYFPLQGRYNRAFGISSYGMTGRFQTAWADFGGLKLPSQLDIELASMAGLGARCDVGDQLPPSGRLDPAVYHVIGKSFARIKSLEPWLDGAAPVSEAALLVDSKPLDRLNHESLYGLTKLLIESHVQFDAVEASAPWEERYGLIVVPDTLRQDKNTADRLLRFLQQGGSLIVSHQGGLLTAEETSWLEPLGFRYQGESPFKPAYLIPEDSFTGEIPPYEYALYEGASQWRVQEPARRAARLGEPLFQRSAEHYTSHAQSPFDHATDYAALSLSNQCALFGFPLGLSYFNRGYWIYRHAFQHALNAVFPRRLVTSDAPLSTEILLTRQKAAASHPERWLVHLINFSAQRGTPKHAVLHEDPIALTNVTVRLSVPATFRGAKTVIGKEELPLRTPAPGTVEFTIPRIPLSEIVCLDTQ